MSKWTNVKDSIRGDHIVLFIRNYDCRVYLTYHGWEYLVQKDGLTVATGHEVSTERIAKTAGRKLMKEIIEQETPNSIRLILDLAKG